MKKVDAALWKIVDDRGYQWVWEMEIYQNMAAFAENGEPWYEELLALSKLPTLSHAECVEVWKRANPSISDELRKRYPYPGGEKRLSVIRDRMLKTAVRVMHGRTKLSRCLKDFIALTSEPSLRIVHFAFVPAMLRQAESALPQKDFSSLVEELKKDYAYGGWGDWAKIETAYRTGTKVDTDFLPS